jgi:hypothetical protein
LHSEAKAVMTLPTLADQVEIHWRERVVTSTLSIGEISRDLGQGIALLRSHLQRCVQRLSHINSSFLEWEDSRNVGTIPARAFAVMVSNA